MNEALLLTSVRVSTYNGQLALTSASGFFFERAGRRYLVTSRHVMIDEPNGHLPDRLEIELHTDPANMADSVNFSIPLYGAGLALWRQGRDQGGEVDVAVIELDRAAMPAHTAYQAFTPEHLVEPAETVEVGSSLLVVGFPLGFHDTLHHMPVARHAIIASAFGLRFQGQGYFLTDARTHSGTSGAPVVMRMLERQAKNRPLPWRLLGIHSARLDMGSRDIDVDEALGLNSAWYADILLTLTEQP